MLILLTNDDGIESQALQMLAQELRNMDVFIVAPEKEMSAVSHSLTIREMLRVEKIPFQGAHAFSVSGTPVDCVKIALDKLLPKPPDIVLSGINKGSNTGINVFYSGTVAAALEAFLLGIPSVAISIDSFEPVHLGVAVDFTSCFIREINKTNILRNYVLNINIPHLLYHEIKGIKITKQVITDTQMNMF